MSEKGEKLCFLFPHFLNPVMKVFQSNSFFSLPLIKIMCKKFAMFQCMDSEVHGAEKSQFKDSHISIRQKLCIEIQ